MSIGVQNKMPKPGRPTQFDRDAALDEAMRAFWRDGYQANSVKALSQRLGITRSSFYNAFDSQEALFLEALERYLDLSPDRPLAQVPDQGSICALITETFRTVCRALAADTEAKGCLLVNSVCALCPTDDELGSRIAAQVIARVERIEALLRAAVDRGELTPDTDAAACALALQTFLVGLNMMAKVVPDKAALWPAARATLAAHHILRESRSGHRSILATSAR
jgi:TetR/AcrR family transcriptional repressor of nem operon